MPHRKSAHLIFDSLFELTTGCASSPKLAERLDHPTADHLRRDTQRGVRFHDGHELTSADVVYTFRSFLDPDFVSSAEGWLSRTAVGRGARSVLGVVHAASSVHVVSHQL